MIYSEFFLLYKFGNRKLREGTVCEFVLQELNISWSRLDITVHVLCCQHKIIPNDDKLSVDTMIL